MDSDSTTITAAEAYEERRSLVYHGTAHTECEYRFLTDYSQTCSAQSKEVTQELYEREFSLGLSFTFVQCGDNPLEPPMGWTPIGEDENVTTLAPEDDDNRCPYLQLQIVTMSRFAQNYHFHVFYLSRGITVDPVSQWKMLSSLRVPPVTKIILILRSKADAALTEMDASIIDRRGDIALKHLDQFLRHASLLNDFVELDRRDEETLLRAQEASDFVAAMKYLGQMCTNMTTDEAKQRVFDKVSTLRSKNFRELMVCYP